MRILDILQSGRPTLSCEVFPPKSEDTFESVRDAADRIAGLRPSYMSVTYGAGGSTSRYSLKIAEHLKGLGVTTLAHLSCIAATPDSLRRELSSLREAGIENILALRGDLPEGTSSEGLRYRHASDLAAEIRRAGGFCVGGACYPESHPESISPAEDLEWLRVKVEAGCEFLTTQMFFDNNIFYDFLGRARAAGISVPIVPGIMPVVNPSSIRRICRISGTDLPARFLKIVDRYGSDPAAMRQAGVAYATAQIIDLYANGVTAVHLYTMNRPEVAGAIFQGLSAILGR